jgi:hypothetical protein
MGPHERKFLKGGKERGKIYYEIYLESHVLAKDDIAADSKVVELQDVGDVLKPLKELLHLDISPRESRKAQRGRWRRVRNSNGVPTFAKWWSPSLMRGTSKTRWGTRRSVPWTRL